MSFLGGLGDGTSSMTPTFFWALLAVAVAVVIAIGIGNYIAAGKAVDKPGHVVNPCSTNGHRYRAHNTEWRSATCGTRVARDGEPHDRTNHGTTSAPQASSFQIGQERP